MGGSAALIHLTTPPPTLPPQFGLLTEVTQFDLGANELAGTIPTQIGMMTSTTQYTVDGNDLTGNVPTQLGNLPLSDRFLLYGNSFSSKIPSEFGRLLEFTSYMNIGHCGWTGTVPTELGQLSNLEFGYVCELANECSERRTTLPCPPRLPGCSSTTTETRRGLCQRSWAS